jgi:hypothetical protein
MLGSALAGLDVDKMLGSALAGLDVDKMLGSALAGLDVLQALLASLAEESAPAVVRSTTDYSELLSWILSVFVFLTVVWYQLEEANRTGLDLRHEDRAHLLYDLATVVGFSLWAKRRGVASMLAFGQSLERAVGRLLK